MSCLKSAELPSERKFRNTALTQRRRLWTYLHLNRHPSVWRHSNTDIWSGMVRTTMNHIHAAHGVRHDTSWLYDTYACQAITRYKGITWNIIIQSVLYIKEWYHNHRQPDLKTRSTKFLNLQQLIIVQQVFEKKGAKRTVYG